MTTEPPLLEVAGLRVDIATTDGTVEAVRSVGLTLGRERLGIVGESGSGKSMLARAVTRTLPPGARLRATRLAFRGIDITTATEAAMRRIRGCGIAMILQDPRQTLNPVLRVGMQVAEACAVRDPVLSSHAARNQALAMLEAVQLPDPERVARLYPHECSGGMAQRVSIAAALALQPAVLIADEATSALDVTVRREILELLDELVTARGMGLVFVSHDLKLVGDFCDRVLVMRHGREVETLDVGNLRNSTATYTRTLLDAIPSLSAPRRRLPVLDRDLEVP